MCLRCATMTEMQAAGKAGSVRELCLHLYTGVKLSGTSSFQRQAAGAAETIPRASRPAENPPPAPTERCGAETQKGSRWQKAHPAQQGPRHLMQVPRGHALKALVVWKQRQMHCRAAPAALSKGLKPASFVHLSPNNMVLWLKCSLTI